MSIHCEECNVLGRECMAGCSAHPDNWYDCKVCKGTGRITAPVVERQEPGYVLAKQTAVEVPGQERKELGYTLLDGSGVFHSSDEVHAAIAEMGLPLGWVSMTVDQLLPGYMMPNTAPPELASQPAPAAVVLPAYMPGDTEDSDVLTDCRNEGWNACLDKVKELNQ